MFCKNCGIELEETMAFCPECGTKTEKIAEVETTVAQAIVAEEPQAVEQAVEEVAAETVQPAEEAAEETCAECSCEECAAVADEPCEGCSCESCAGATEDSYVNMETTADQPAAEYTEETQAYMGDVLVAPAKSNKKLMATIIAIFIMVALVVTGVFVVPGLFSGKYETVAEKYSVAYAEADLIEASNYSITSYAEVYEKMVTYSCEEYGMTREEFFELLSEQSGETVTSVEQLFAIAKEEGVTYLKEEYGNYTLSAKAVGAEKMTDEDYAELIDYIKEDQSYDYPSMFDGVDTSKISEAYVVEVEIKIDGSEASDTEIDEVTVIKYNGKWKAIGE